MRVPLSTVLNVEHALTAWTLAKYLASTYVDDINALALFLVHELTAPTSQWCAARAPASAPPERALMSCATPGVLSLQAPVLGRAPDHVHDTALLLAGRAGAAQGFARVRVHSEPRKGRAAAVPAARAGHHHLVPGQYVAFAPRTPTAATGSRRRGRACDGNAARPP